MNKYLLLLLALLALVNGTIRLHVGDNLEQVSCLTASPATTTPAPTGRFGTITLLTSNMNPSLVGQMVQFSAQVFSVPPGMALTGTVTFRIGAIIVGVVPVIPSGLAVLNLTTATAGNFTIIATYNGDPLHSSSTSNPVLQVVLPAATTTEFVVIPRSPAPFGTNLTYQAGVAPQAPGSGVPTGNVTLVIDGVPEQTVALSNSLAFFAPVSNLSPGAHIVIANYSGDSNFLPSATSPSPQIITPANVVQNAQPYKDEMLSTDCTRDNCRSDHTHENYVISRSSERFLLSSLATSLSLLMYLLM